MRRAGRYQLATGLCRLSGRRPVCSITCSNTVNRFATTTTTTTIASSASTTAMLKTMIVVLSTTQLFHILHSSASVTVEALAPEVQSDLGNFGYKMISSDLSSPATGGDPKAINKLVVHELASNGLAHGVEPSVNLDGSREWRHPTANGDTKKANSNKVQSTSGNTSPSGQPSTIAAAAEPMAASSRPDEVISQNNDTSQQLQQQQQLQPSPRPPGGKSRRQALSQKQRVSDWWTELLIKNKLDSTKSRTSAPPKRPDLPPPEYKEQPLSQNAVLTFRNQLVAIRDKHRLLLTKAVPQLQQLDQKLVDSYRLLMKRKMPLYAGMLYRSRDFVVRMANEVKHERQVLEAMARQVQKVLKDRMANKTLVKEFSKSAPSISGTAELEKLTSLPLVELAQETDEVLEIVVPGSSNNNNKQSETLKVGQPARGGASSDEATTTSNHLVQEPKRGKLNNNKSQWKSKAMVQKGGSLDDYELEESGDCVTAKPPKRQVKYTVHINEVNLKKELGKTQALIDRINGSYHELSSVIEDILYLFRLTSDPKRGGLTSSGKTSKMDRVHGGSGGGNQMLSSSELAGAPMTPEQQRKLRKMLKSPIRLYLERYGKLTSGPLERFNSTNPAPSPSQSMRLVNNQNPSTSSSETAVPFEYPADVKPLFEPAFSDLSTLDLGPSMNEPSTSSSSTEKPI